MSSIRFQGSSSENTPPKVQYEIIVAVFNKKSGVWEEGSGTEGAKVANLIKEKGGIGVFARAQPGDVIGITESGIYTKSNKGWVNALTEKEAKDVFPHLNLTMQVASKRIPIIREEGQGSPTQNVSQEFMQEVVKKESAPTNIVMEIQVTDRTAPDVTALVKQIEHKHPELAHNLSHNAQALSAMLKEYNALQKKEGNNNDQLSRISNQIDSAEKELKQLIETARTATYSEAYIKQTNPKYTELDRGKAKIVYIREDDPLHAYFVPVTSGLFEKIMGSKESEIKKEVLVAKNIKARLFKSFLVTLLKSRNVKDAEKITDKIVDTFPTVKALTDALANLSEEELAKKLFITSEAAEQLLSLKDQIPKIAQKWKNLAVELEEMTGSDMYEGKYTLRTELATEGNLENKIRQGGATLRERVGYVSGFMHGMETLHEAGYVHGDLKPENILIYDEGVKISDWGKTRTLKGNQQLMYTGNGRFAAPERKLSKQAEVYGSALVMIRILEEGLLDPGTAMINGDPEKVDPLIQPAKNRRGIEKFVVMSDVMSQTEGNLRGRVRTYGPSLITQTVDLDAAQQEIYSYIDMLTNKMQSTLFTAPEKALALNTLLKKMTSSNPLKRGTISEAAHDFDTIGLP